MRPARLLTVMAIALPGLASTPSGSRAMERMTMRSHTMGAAVDKAFMDSMRSMNKGMNAPMTGDADKNFVAMMRPHHQGAIAMAKVELRYGKDRKLRRLARAIVTAQETRDRRHESLGRRSAAVERRRRACNVA